MAFIELIIPPICLYCIDTFIQITCIKLLNFFCSPQDVVGGYKCECAMGWTGTHCDININDCAPGSCLNGGICYVSCVVNS